MTWPIGPGSTVKIHYVITLADGTVASSTEGEAPHEFVMGDGSTVRGLELAIYGLKAGDEQEINIDPEEAYGFPSDDLIKDIPKEQFQNFDIIEGSILAFDSPDGEIPGTVKTIGEDKVTIDFNHPLAGHVLNYKVKILEVGPPEGYE